MPGPGNGAQHMLNERPGGLCIESTKGGRLRGIRPGRFLFLIFLPVFSVDFFPSAAECFVQRYQIGCEAVG